MARMRNREDAERGELLFSPVAQQLLIVFLLFQADDEDTLEKFDYSHFYTRKLQGLLCSGLIRNSDCLLDNLAEMAR